MTREEKLVLWEDRREIKNLMGRISMAIILKKEDSLFESFWSNREDVCLGVNDGWYLGKTAVSEYYRNAVALMRKSDSVMRQRFSFMKEFEPDDHGFGYLEAKTLSEGVLEVAGDRETAKGLWPCAGQTTDYTTDGPITYWTFGWFAVDFIREDEFWKVWHMSYLEDIKHPMGEKWWEPAKKREPFAEFSVMSDVKTVTPNVPVKLREYYSTERRFTQSQPIPLPYEHFSDTFSYGI